MTAATNPLAAFAATVLLDAVSRADDGLLRGVEPTAAPRAGWHRQLGGDDRPEIAVVLDAADRAFVLQAGELRAFVGWEETRELLPQGWRLTVDRGQGLVIEEYFLSGGLERRDEAVGWAVELLGGVPLSQPA